MHVSFYVEPQWLIFAAGLFVGSAVAAAIAYALLRQQLVSLEASRAKSKASRWVEYAWRNTVLTFSLYRGPICTAQEANHRLPVRVSLPASHGGRAGGVNSTGMLCRSYSPRRVRARRGDTHEHENGVSSSQTRSNGQTPSVIQVTRDAVGSTFGFAVTVARQGLLLTKPMTYSMSLRVILNSRGAWTWLMQLYRHGELLQLVGT